MVGDIAILKLRPEAKGREAEAAEAILKEMTNVKCVYGQEGGIEGDHRLRRLRHIGGEERTVTVHKENGVRLKLDVETCYFSPRLSTERLRIAEKVSPGDRVLNMFAGVGPYSVLIAKKARVWSCEINHAAVEFHVENNRLNKVERRVEMLEGEGFDKVLMPHPSQSDRFLPAASRLLSPGGVAYYYRHATGEDEAEAERHLRDELVRLAPELSVESVRRVRLVGPRFVELVAELRKGPSRP